MKNKKRQKKFNFYYYFLIYGGETYGGYGNIGQRIYQNTRNKIVINFQNEY